MKEQTAPLFEVELLKADEVAKIFKTTPGKVSAAISNHTLPIGFVAPAERGGRERTIIVKKRLEAWLLARDLIKTG